MGTQEKHCRGRSTTLISPPCAQEVTPTTYITAASWAEGKWRFVFKGRATHGLMRLRVHTRGSAIDSDW